MDDYFATLLDKITDTNGMHISWCVGVGWLFHNDNMQMEIKNMKRVDQNV